MDTGELIKKINRIEIISKKITNTLFSGMYQSSFHGYGLEFNDLRKYYPGDEVRHIDWNVTARQNKPFVKKFCEERLMNLFLIIDMSGSSYTGHKKKIISELAAALAFSAVKNNDKVGAIFFTDRVEKMIVSGNGRRYILSIISNLLEFEPSHKETNISAALKYFNKVIKKKSIVFLISDFFDTGFEKDIKRTDLQHDLIAVRIIDKSEEKIPEGIIIQFEDAESGEMKAVNTSNSSLNILKEADIPAKNIINIYSDEDFVKPLQKFFYRRMKR